MVASTASLWTAINHAKEKENIKVVRTILRQPANISLVGIKSTNSGIPYGAYNPNSNSGYGRGGSGQERNGKTGYGSSNSSGYDEYQDPGYIIIVPTR